MGPQALGLSMSTNQRGDFDMYSDKPVVLVIDDSPEHIELISNVLRDEYVVKAATNGERGLQIAIQDPKPELVLLDIIMPDIDGFEVCKQLKKNPITASIPVIFLTAQCDVDKEQSGFDLGAVDYITKPISPPIMRVRVRSQIDAYSNSRLLTRQVKDKTVEIARN